MTKKTDIRDSDEKVVEIEMERLRTSRIEKLASLVSIQNDIKIRNQFLEDFILKYYQVLKKSQNGCRWNAFHVLEPGKF